MAPELLLVVCLHQLTRRSNLITSLPILTLLLHVFICTCCFSQHSQMNMQWYNDDDLLEGDNEGGIKICLIVSKLKDNQSQFIQKLKNEKPMFEKANRITAPAYSLPHPQRPGDTDIDCIDYLSKIPLSFELGNNLSTPFLLSVPRNITKISQKWS